MDPEILHRDGRYCILVRRYSFSFTERGTECCDDKYMKEPGCNRFASSISSVENAKKGSDIGGGSPSSI